jgi:hypothetical protein
MSERYLGRIVPDMEVCDINGSKIGTIAHVYRHELATTASGGLPSEQVPEDVIEVKSGFLGLGKHYYIPLSAVQEVTSGCVFLTKTQDELQSLGWDRRPEHLPEKA